MANSQDPHRPFAGSQQEAQRSKPTPKNSKSKYSKKQNSKKRNSQKFPPAPRTYRPDEVPVPRFLPDLPNVRKEMAEYYSSVHRADAIVGSVLRALKESGREEDTIVMFVSDHGMPLPFAKTNCYYHSTRTPWIVSWPGVVKAGTVDKRHFVSGIDLMPTALAALGLPEIGGMDGRSFLPLLHGETQDNRDHVVTVFHETAGKRRYEMRSVITRQFSYIRNFWSDGETVFRNESQSGLTMNAMKAAAKNDPEIAARVKLFLHRVPEELYRVETDPDSLHNLADDPKFAEQKQLLRQTLGRVLQSTNDPLANRLTDAE